MRCILHIGTEKTGSTSIQRFLLNNREALHATGVHVCTSAGNGNNRAMPAAFISDNIEDDFINQNNLQDADTRKAWKREACESITAEVLQAKQSADVFVVSSEHFHSRLVKTEDILELHAFLSPLFDEIKVVCYLRRQDRMSVSRYSQSLKAGFVRYRFFRPDVTPQCHDLPLYFDFQALLDRWAHVFGEENIVPRIYSHDALVNGDVLDDFLHVTGIEHAGAIKPAKRNAALSGEAQATLLRINRSMEKVNTASANALRKEIVSFLELNRAGQAGKPERAEAEFFYHAFDASNEAVARRWFGRNKLFDDDFSEYPVKKTVVDSDRILDILVEFMLGRDEA